MASYGSLSTTSLNLCIRRSHHSSCRDSCSGRFSASWHAGHSLSRGEAWGPSEERIHLHFESWKVEERRKPKIVFGRGWLSQVERGQVSMSVVLGLVVVEVDL